MCLFGEGDSSLAGNWTQENVLLYDLINFNSEIMALTLLRSSLAAFSTDGLMVTSVKTLDSATHQRRTSAPYGGSLLWSFALRGKTTHKRLSSQLGEPIFQVFLLRNVWAQSERKYTAFNEIRAVIEEIRNQAASKKQHWGWGVGSPISFRSAYTYQSPSWDRSSALKSHDGEGRREGLLPSEYSLATL